MAELPERRPSCRFGPNRRLAGAGLGLAIVAALVAGLGHDPQGRLLAGCAAAVLLIISLADLLFWPRLSASADGVVVKAPAARAHLPWSQIDVIRVDERSRLGLSSRTLEIDAGERLIVLSKRSLGADPRDVQALVTAFDPR